SGTEKIPPCRGDVLVRIERSVGSPRADGDIGERGSAERVKRCGKSAPRPWQHGWQAKPRTEQDQIRRPAASAAADGPSVEAPGRSLDSASDGGARGMIAIRLRPRATAETEFGL